MTLSLHALLPLNSLNNNPEFSYTIPIPLYILLKAQKFQIPDNNQKVLYTLGILTAPHAPATISET